MKQITVPKDFFPRPYQLKLFQAMDGVKGDPSTKVKRALLRWCRRAGKDTACFAYMAKEAAQTPGIYYYFFPSYQQGRKAIWEHRSMTEDGRQFNILEMLPDELIEKKNQNEMKIELKNKSIIRIIGTDNIDTIVGTNPIGCIFSEYSLQDPRAWKYISPILAVNGGWAIFNGTPRGRNHMFEMEQRIKTNPQWYFSEIQTLWADEPNYVQLLTQEQLDEERIGMDEDTICQEYGASYSAATKGAYYSEAIQKARESGRIGEFPPRDDKYTDTFWDIGVDDSTAVWFKQVWNGVTVFVDYYEASGKDLSHYIKVLEEKGYNYRTHFLPWDGNKREFATARFTTQEIFRMSCRDAKISDDVVVAKRVPVQERINATRSRFGSYCFNEGTCLKGITHLELYHRRYDPRRDMFLKEPVHDETSHAADAISVEAVMGDTAIEELFYQELTIINDSDDLLA